VEEKKEEELELVDMLEPGCYAVMGSIFGGGPTDCTTALHSDRGLVLLFVKAESGPEAIVVHATPDGDIVETYDYIEDAILEIKRVYGEDTVEELLEQALDTSYSIEMLRRKLRELYEKHKE
jgi:hypothetical protein